MKTSIHSLISFLLLLCGVVTFSSCDETISTKIIMPHAVFQYEGFLFVGNGESLNIKKFDIDREQSSDGIYIDQVTYYFDGKQIATSNSYPFSLDYLIQNQSIGKHTLEIVSLVKGEGYTDTKFTVTLSVYVLEEPFVLDFQIKWNNTISNGTIQNGDILSGTVELKETTLDVTITKVEFYWDDQLFSATSKAPYQFNFPIENEKIGTHLFKYVIYTDTNVGSLETTHTMELTIEQ